MKRMWIIPVILLLFSGTGQAIEAERRLIPVETLTKNNSAFAIDLYHQLCGSKGNLFISPYSISTALAMTYAGSRGNTQEQMAKALRFSLPQQDIHGAFAELDARLMKVRDRGTIKLNVANSLWPQKDYRFLDEYLALIRKYYGVSITPVDYKNASEAARETINRWVEKKTEQMIKNLIQPGVLDKLTRLVLVSAIHFKGMWTWKFDPARTKNEPFFISPRDSVQTPFMRQEGHFKYAEIDSVQMLELPYRGGTLSMLILLPREKNGLTELERRFSAENLSRWQSALTEREVDVSLPKFKIASTFRLDQALSAMGMVDAFIQTRADFSGMDGKPGWLFIGTVMHQAYGEVNEEGTEAAAATAVEAPKAEPTSESPLVFRADRPFLFLIRENKSGALLFLGKVIDPTRAGE
jgi:serine protease inhibitor